jgi:cardiolipin synthase A/B
MPAEDGRTPDGGGPSVKLIIEPADGVAPLISAIKRARTSVEIAVFRLDRKDVETALVAAAARGVRVTALIAFANRGGEKLLRQLESRFLAAGIIVARTSNDLVRYHGKYILIDRRVLVVLSFNFTHLDIDHSRGFGVMTSRPNCLQEAATLFKADCTRTSYAPKVETFVVSPANSRRLLGTFLKRARTQLLIYDPMISDREMLGILQARTKAGVEVKVIGRVSGRVPFEVQKLAGIRLHTRTIIRDRRQAFVGSQSLRTLELDSRREVGLIILDPKAVKQLLDAFESDWTAAGTKGAPPPPDPVEAPAEEPAGASPKETAKAVAVFTEELQPLAATVREAVRQAVAKAGEDVLQDKDVKDTMKKVAKQAIKEAVKDAVQDAVQDAHDAPPPKGAT